MASRESVIVQLRLLGSAAMSREAKAAGRALDGLGKSASRAETRGLNRLHRGAKSLGSGLESMIRVGTRAAFVLGSITAAAAGFIGKAGFGMNRIIDRQRVAFETYTGSAKKAAWIMQEVQRIATESPALGLEDAGAGVQALMSYGFAAKDAVKYVRILSDAAAASGQNIGLAMDRGALALGQIAAKGKLSTEELNQLSESLRLNRSTVAKHLGLAKSDLEVWLRDGSISSEQALPAIAAAFQEQSKGASKKFSNTTEGRLARLGDVWQQKAAAFTRPFYNQFGRLGVFLAKRLEKIDTKKIGAKIFGAIAAGIKAVASVDWGSIISGLQRFATTALEAGRGVMDAFRPAVPFMKNVLWPALKGIGKGVASTLVVAFKILVPIIRVASRALGWIGEKAKPLAPWFERIGFLVGALFPGPFLRALGVATKGFAAAGGTVGAMGGIIGRVLRLISTPLRLLIRLFKAIGRGVKSAGELMGKAAGGIQRSWGPLGTWFGRMWGGIRRVFASAWRWIKNIVDRVTGAVEKITGAIAALNVFDLQNGTNTFTNDIRAAGQQERNRINAQTASRPTRAARNDYGKKRAKGYIPRVAAASGGDLHVYIDGEPVRASVIRRDARAKARR